MTPDERDAVLTTIAKGADWFAAGLPREGREAHTPRVVDVAKPDAPTRGIAENVRAVRDRVCEGGFDVCVVVDAQRVVLGLVSAKSLDADPRTRVEQVMQSSPVTFQPNLDVGKLVLRQNLGRRASS